MTWAEQAERIRELNARCIEVIAARIEADQVSDEDVTLLGKLSGIAKAWTAESRMSGDGAEDDEPLSKQRDDKLMRAASGG